MQQQGNIITTMGTNECKHLPFLLAILTLGIRTKWQKRCLFYAVTVYDFEKLHVTEPGSAAQKLNLAAKQ